MHTIDAPSADPARLMARRFSKLLRDCFLVHRLPESPFPPNAPDVSGSLAVVRDA